MNQVEWAKCRAHELRAAAEADAIVILPIASIEQHGPHLPVDTDSRIVYEISVRAARLAVAGGCPTVVAPVVWSGLSEHHIPFGGTLSVDFLTFSALLRDLASSLQRQGFRRLLIHNGHGGNINAMKVITQDLTLEMGLTVLATTYATQADAALAELLEDQPRVMHACEAETSMLLALAPDLVDDSDLAALAVGAPTGAGYGDGAAYAWRSFASVTPNGVRGNPARASAEKGEKLLAVASRGIADLLVDTDAWAEPGDLRQAETGGVRLRD